MTRPCPIIARVAHGESWHRLNQHDVENLTRARIVLDSIYDVVMALNLSVKPILVAQLREAHEIIYGLEQVGARPFLIKALRLKRLWPSQLPPWFAQEVAEAAHDKAEQSKAEG